MISVIKENLKELIDAYVMGIDCSETECPVQENCWGTGKRCNDSIKMFLGIKENDNDKI